MIFARKTICIDRESLRLSFESKRTVLLRQQDAQLIFAECDFNAKYHNCMWHEQPIEKSRFYLHCPCCRVTNAPQLFLVTFLCESILLLFSMSVC